MVTNTSATEISLTLYAKRCRNATRNKSLQWLTSIWMYARWRTKTVALTLSWTKAPLTLSYAEKGLNQAPFRCCARSIVFSLQTASTSALATVNWRTAWTNTFRIRNSSGMSPLTWFQSLTYPPRRKLLTNRNATRLVKSAKKESSSWRTKQRRQA